MSFRSWIFARLQSWRTSANRRKPKSLSSHEFEALVRAHGDWLAFLAAVLEREGVIAGSELARSLTEFASVTATDRPEEARILAFWAAYLQDTSVALRDLPSLH